MDWKRARRCVGIVCLSARSLILCGLRAAPYSQYLAIHKPWVYNYVVSWAIRVFNVWRRARILAARVVGENTSVLRKLFVCSA